MNPSTSSAGSVGQSPVDDHMDDWLLISSDSAGPQGSEMITEDRETEDRGKLKSKLVSAWNSVKYGVNQFYINNRSVCSLVFCEITLSLLCIRLVLETKISLQQELSCDYVWTFLSAQWSRLDPRLQFSCIRLLFWVYLIVRSVD